jgi:hypothetical protein
MKLKNVVIVKLPSLLNENDFHISQVALKLTTLISKSLLYNHHYYKV